MIIVWSIVVVGVARILWDRETRRVSAERALERVYEQLCSQTEELETHRERLIHLVEKRTSELTVKIAEHAPQTGSERE